MISQIKHFIPSLAVIAVIAVAISTGFQVVTMPIADANVPLATYDSDDLGGGAKKTKKAVAAPTATTPKKLPNDGLGGKEYKDGTYYGTAKGYKSNITVAVKVKAQKIVSIKITDQHEDQEYLVKARAVIGAILKTQSTNVDAVSGCTYSSNGIIMAVRDALKKAVVGKPGKVPAPTKPPVADDAPVIPDEDGLTGKKYADGVYRGSAEGYSGLITVEVTIADGAIGDVRVVSHTDDEEYMVKCYGLLTGIVAQQSTNIDAVSGCTYSSKGIIMAVRAALKQAIADDAGADEDLDAPIKVEDPDAGYPAVKGQYVDGEYSGKAIGFEGYIYLTVTVLGGDITKIEVTRQVEEPYYYNSAVRILERIIKRQTTEGIDTVSGATFTSKGLLGAVDVALAKARIV